MDLGSQTQIRVGTVTQRKPRSSCDENKAHYVVTVTSSYFAESQLRGDLNNLHFYTSYILTL